MDADQPHKKEGPFDLFEYTEEQLLRDHELTHYQILHVQEYASMDAIKKAYRKASLKYHPDKTGRGDDDYVFLAVKAAYDTLSDHGKRQAYDSTVIPFDDSVPSAARFGKDSKYTDQDFYDTFGPVFERNLRFDMRLRPELANNKKNSSSFSSSSSSQRRNNNGQNGSNGSSQPPTLGDDNTDMAQVHAFYDYWIHFESWRDFSAAAANELEVENELENAESRFEKRWIQKEIDKRAKQLKKQEMTRIQNLVERAMEADPRLRRERQAAVEAKERAKREREEAEQRKKEEEELEKVRQAEREEEEKRKKAEEKLVREKEKKLVRKAKQQLRKMTSSSFEEHAAEFSSIWEDAYDMNQDVEMLCTTLDLEQLRDLNWQYEQIDCGQAALYMIRQRAEEARNPQPGAGQEGDHDHHDATDGNNNNSNGFNGGSSSSNHQGGGNKRPPWSKDELSALAKAIKKYPPGGANRWDQIALMVNNLCQQDHPRSKEECIEKYNAIARNAQRPESGASSQSKEMTAAKDTTTPATATTAPEETRGEAASSSPAADSTTAVADDHTPADDEAGAADDVWSAEQDQQLQDGLAKYPASLDKNERWALIAKGVTGKSKKQCVQRFQTIRNALKSRK